MATCTNYSINNFAHMYLPAKHIRYSSNYRPRPTLKLRINTDIESTPEIEFALRTVDECGAATWGTRWVR